MLKKELIEKLTVIAGEGEEFGHEKADMLLLQYINDKDIAAAFTALIRWYA